MGVGLVRLATFILVLDLIVNAIGIAALATFKEPILDYFASGTQVLRAAISGACQ